MIHALGQDSNFAFLKEAMDVASNRHQVITSNIANIDTPGYKARDMDFNGYMKDFESMQEHDQAVRVSNAREGATPIYETTSLLNYKDYEIDQPSDFLKQRFDGNNVDLDKEMGKMATNQGRFKLAVQFMNRKFRLIGDTLNSSK